MRETGINQDGRTPTITSPSLDAQVKLIHEVYQRVGLDPSSDIGYVEAHMTGTPTGDPIEAEALARTFGAGRAESDPVLVGSSKPNIGHTEPVSGLAALLKTIFVLKEGAIPANANYKNTNPNIPLKEWRLTVSESGIGTQCDLGRDDMLTYDNYGRFLRHSHLGQPTGHDGPG